MLKDEQSEKLGVFSSVEISDYKFFKPSELSDNVIPNHHHLYMIVGINRAFITSYETDYSNRKLITIAIQSEHGDKFELEWHGNDIVNSVEVFPDKRGLVVNGEKILVSDLILAVDAQVIVKILYIGQAQGEDGNRNAKNRLVSHSTLQKILADVNDYQINYDLRIISFGITENLMWTNLTTEETSNASLNDIYTLENNQFNFSIKFSDTINLVEAKLINYFKPSRYNKNYVKNFVPSKIHKSYKQYNKLFNSMSISLNALENFRLTSDLVNFNPKVDCISYSLNETEFLDLVGFKESFDNREE